MDNKDKIIKVANELGLKIGCYNDSINALSKNELKKVLYNIEFQSDTDVSINRKKYVVEIDIVDAEVDFNLLSKQEFINRYGDERYLHS